MSTPTRILILAKDFNQAKTYARLNNLPFGYWVYVASFHIVLANKECDYITLPGWEDRIGIEEIKAHLKRSEGEDITNNLRQF